jgi:D-alanine transaminase
MDLMLHGLPFTIFHGPFSRLPMLVYLNGQFLDRSEAHLSVEDRGFVFGDGVYEVWRVVQGSLFETERHFQRLERGLSELRITRPREATLDRIEEIAARLLHENDLTDGEATLYLEITRGAATRTHYFPAASTAPTVFLAVKRFVAPEELRAAGVRAITVPDIRWLRCDIKTVQLLPNVLANEQAHASGAFDAIFVRDDVVTESTHASVFGVLDGVLRTHPANNLVLPGITREVLLELARELGIPVREDAIPARDIPRLEELFLTGTTTDVTPIVQLDGARIGRGVPGPISLRLYAALRERLYGAESAGTKLGAR